MLRGLCRNCYDFLKLYSHPPDESSSSSSSPEEGGGPGGGTAFGTGGLFNVRFTLLPLNSICNIINRMATDHAPKKSKIYSQGS